MSAAPRARRLRELVLDRAVVGLEPLLDLLLCVYQELSASPLAQEKYIREFLQWGESSPTRTPGSHHEIKSPSWNGVSDWVWDSGWGI
uniref:Uncharacterized protein n=1 Tax=Pelusios castaneus TaxID=367368 RepID=A0A8C8RUW7_9SAUR